MIQIRTGTRDDAEIIHRFVRELAEYERQPSAVEATVETFRADLSRPVPPFECLVADHDGEPAGFALFFHNYSTWKGRQGIWLEDLFVTPAFRRRGIGLALLRAVARIASERDCGRLEWAVLDWNQPAIDFYESLGGEKQDEWRIFRIAGEGIGKVARS